MASYSTNRAWVRSRNNLLPNDGYLCFVSSQSEQDEISIGAKEAVTHVAVVIRLCRLASDKIHDFVLAFARHASIREEHHYVGPAGIRAKLFVDVRTHNVSYTKNKFGSRRDAVLVKLLRCRLFHWKLQMGKRWLDYEQPNNNRVHNK